MADINAGLLTFEAGTLLGAGHQVPPVTCDVADEGSVAAAVTAAVENYGRLDMAFNNAGIQVPPTDAAEEPAQVFDRVNTVNLRGVWASMKHELAVMRNGEPAPS